MKKKQQKGIKSNVITIVVCAAFLCVLNFLMFGLLKPQDEYTMTVGTVTKGIWIDTVYEKDKGIVEYYVDYVKYEHQYSTFMFNRQNDGNKYLIRYKADDPEIVRSAQYPIYMSLIIFGEFISLLIIALSVKGIIKVLKPKENRVKPDREKADNIDKRKTKRSRISFYVIAAVCVMMFIGILISQPIYNSVRNYSGEVYNYSFASAQQLESDKDSCRLRFTKKNKSVYLTVRPRHTEYYFMSLTPGLDYGFRVYSDGYEILYDEINSSSDSVKLPLESGRVYYIVIDYEFPYKGFYTTGFSIQAEHGIIIGG